MEIAPQAPRTVVRCILAGLIVLAVSACVGPETGPAGGRQGADRNNQMLARADLAVQEAPQDPIKVIGEAMEAQIRVILAAAHPDPTK
jgi:hypothetical protein